jgi:hypothetical protein
LANIAESSEEVNKNQEKEVDKTILKSIYSGVSASDRCRRKKRKRATEGI